MGWNADGVIGDSDRSMLYKQRSSVKSHVDMRPKKYGEEPGLVIREGVANQM